MEHYSFVLRLIICFILSFIIGFEREIRGSSAGLRINIIVCLGAFLFTSATFGYFDDDIMRIPAQIVSGIGFIGAGIIAVDSNKIKGLNTAAIIWCVAAIGVLVGLNLIFETCAGTVAILLINLLARKIKKIIAPDRYLDDYL